jgi:cardiolipin synthase
MPARCAWIRYGQILLLAGLLAACAGDGEQRANRAPGELAGTVPASAWYSSDRLVLEYPAREETLYLAARWPDDNLRTDRHNYRAAHLEAWAPEPGSTPRLARGTRHAELMAAGDWAAVTEAIMARLVPPAAGSAVAFFAQGEPMLAFRDPDGRLQIVRRDAPAALLPVLAVLDEDRFAAEAEAVIAERYPEARNGPLLFPAGDHDDAFVLVDLPRRLSVFLVRPYNQGGEAFGHSLGFSLRLADAVVLRSHVLAPLNRPVSTVTQLLSYTWHTTRTLLPGHPAANGTSTVPAVSSGAGMDLQAFEARLDAQGAAPRQRGRVRFLIDGPAFFDALSRSIQQACASIKVRVYIFGTDDFALRIADQLKARADEVDVQVLVDYLGSLTAGSAHHGGPRVSASGSSIFAHLTAGSQVRVRASSNTWLTGDHTKTIVVDGQRAFIGGMNIDRQYRYDWHDMMAEVEGPIVARLEADFDGQWAATGPGGDWARLLARARPGAEPPPSQEGVDLRPLYTSPGNAQILRALVDAIRSARQRIYIQNPYVTDDEVIGELVQARRRGVDVRLILPSRSDSNFMTSANLVAASVLISNGVRVYVYPGMSHLKAALVDGWAMFGSANLDKLSLRLNLETNLASSDPSVAAALMDQLFEPDFARARELEYPPARGFGTYLVNVLADHL